MNRGSAPIEKQLTAWLLRKTLTAGARRVAPLAAAIASEIGSVRRENQDRAIIARGVDGRGRDYAVLVVADGIGGMRDGATCASIAIAAFLAALYQDAQIGSGRSDDWIRRAVNSADQAVYTRFRGEGGSTLVALVVRPEHHACWLSVGDSRVYGVRSKKLVQISVDDTIAGQLGKGADSTPEQSTLLQFIGMGKELEPHVAELEGDAIDSVILTTDGVHFLAPSPKWLGQIINNAPDLGVCVKRLVDLAKWCGGPDNATVAMIKLSDDREQQDRPPYACLEVWDAFGELQIIANEVTREEPSMGFYHVPIINQTSAAVSDVPSQVSEVASPLSRNPTRSPQTTSKARRPKAARKPKNAAGKLAGDVSEPSETETPQLFMEFPPKSK